MVHRRRQVGFWLMLAAALLLAGTTTVGAAVLIQCPGDADLNGIPDGAADPTNPVIGGTVYSYPSNTRCIHLSAGDGFSTMADGRLQYMFGFGDVTGIPQGMSLDAGILAAEWPAPTIVQDEGDEFYLSLTNVGMMIRPDLFDPHTVHYHGFPNAAPIFDGMPDASIAINMGSTFPFYYKVMEPGTYMYHCHVEATEHMQMGMLGNLYVRPAQNRLPNGTALGAHVHSNPDWDDDRNQDNPLIGDTYVYNDGDGSTRYDVDAPVQIGSFDPDFHDASMTVQPLPFALMSDKYPMLNGRGYPDTVNTSALPPPVDDNGDPVTMGKVTQKVHTLITATVGQRLLLRISNLNVTRFDTLATTLGVPMNVVGRNAKLLRGPDGKDLTYRTNSVTLGGGESVDALIYLDPALVRPGRYFLYSTQLNLLSNDQEDFGGMMTEIRVN
jgi:FtsP/CotA-like multicopper oxidase with cupredoxin domain